jgi:3-isopropylmalate/(R)-2-methylmalate dehydratase small subunit
VERFTALTAIAAPLPWANLNTDDIFPAPGASPVARAPGGRDAFRDRTTMGVNAFAAYRWTEDGQPSTDFVLNRAPYDRARILIARENFGCGSSREMAVWCLIGIGLRCIIAPSFGDIFYNNCFKNGLLPVRLPADDIEELLQLAGASGDRAFTVDLETCLITAPDGRRKGFEVGEYQRHALLNGLDEIAATMTRLPAIQAHEKAYLAQRPWLLGSAP